MGAGGEGLLLETRAKEASGQGDNGASTHVKQRHLEGKGSRANALGHLRRSKIPKATVSGRGQEGKKTPR